MKHRSSIENIKLLLNDLENGKITPLQMMRGLMENIRPNKFSDVADAEAKIESLTKLLKAEPETKKIFTHALVKLVGNANQTQLFTHVTALSRSGFFAELRKLLMYKILPPVSDINELGYIIRYVFYKKSDFQWVAQLQEKVLVDFMDAAGILPAGRLPDSHYIIRELQDDIQLLTQVVTALSIDNSIIKNFPELLTSKSPFVILHDQLTVWIKNLKQGVAGRNHQDEEYQTIILSWHSCEAYVRKIHDSKDVFGTSLHMTIVLQKLRKCLKRLMSLINLLVSGEPNDMYFLAQFSKAVVKIENRKYSLANFVNETISTLAFQITEHTGKSGEHYLTNTRAEYKNMFFKSLKGGFIIAFMVILKFLIGILKLPIFQDTLLKGFNYSLGFVGIHIWHGVVATKQPAMTASTIAQSIESTTSHEEIKELGNVIIKVFRSQFAAVMGNLLMVFPVTFIITFAYYRFTGSPLMPVEEAHHKFELVNPIHSLAILHAAIAGVMLFLSGILSGLADNGNMFNKYAERLQHGGLIQKLIGIRKTKIFSRYISHNLGSLTGNFSLGFLLAIVAFIGFITGTPLDIQHVTFATGNLGFATASIYDHITIREAFWAIAGIAAIGLTNIGVSFSLTMVVAIKSRGIDLALTPAIVRYVLRKFFKAPLDFFLPRY